MGKKLFLLMVVFVILVTMGCGKEIDVSEGIFDEEMTVLSQYEDGINSEIVDTVSIDNNFMDDNEKNLVNYTIDIHNTNIDLSLPIQDGDTTNYNLYNFTIEELNLLRNSYYAKYGYVFKSSFYTDYFLDQEWYIKNESVTDVNSLISSIDVRNVDLIRELENYYDDEARNNNYVYEGYYKCEMYEDGIYCSLSLYNFEEEHVEYSLSLFKNGTEQAINNKGNYTNTGEIYDDINGVYIRLLGDKIEISLENNDEIFMFKKMFSLTDVDFTINNNIYMDMAYSDIKMLYDIEEELDFGIEFSEDLIDSGMPVFGAVEMDGIVLEFYSSSVNTDDCRLYQYIVYNDKFETYRGIRVGDSIQKVMQYYGEPDGDVDDELIYYCGSFKLSFRNNEGIVEYIKFDTEM